MKLYIYTMEKKIIIYHNPRWGKSRNSVGILDQKGLSYKIIKYIDSPLSVLELKELGDKLGLRPKDFIRKGEQDFKELNLASKLDNDDALFNAISKFPKLMERPIVVHGNKACIGRPPEKILEII